MILIRFIFVLKSWFFKENIYIFLKNVSKGPFELDFKDKSIARQWIEELLFAIRRGSSFVQKLCLLMCKKKKKKPVKICRSSTPNNARS